MGAAYDDYKIQCAKEYVAYIEALMRQTSVAKFELEQLESLTQPGGVSYDGASITTSTDPKRHERAMVELMERKEALEMSQISGMAQIAAFYDRLEALETEGGTIVRLHYLRFPGGYSYPEIGAQLGYSKATSFRRRDEGLIELYDRGLPEQFAPVEAALI